MPIDLSGSFVNNGVAITLLAVVVIFGGCLARYLIIRLFSDDKGLITTYVAAQIKSHESLTETMATQAATGDKLSKILENMDVQVSEINEVVHRVEKMNSSEHTTFATMVLVRCFTQCCTILERVGVKLEISDQIETPIQAMRQDLAAHTKTTIALQTQDKS